jgi:hypothetical protein
MAETTAKIMRQKMLNYTIKTYSRFGNCEYKNEEVRFQASVCADEATWQLEVLFPDWEEDCYVFAPACAYDGNRIRQVDRIYPPMYLQSEMDKNAQPIIMKGIPALNVDGSGKIEVTAGDMATPCVGIYFKKK